MMARLGSRGPSVTWGRDIPILDSGFDVLDLQCIGLFPFPQRIDHEQAVLKTNSKNRNDHSDSVTIHSANGPPHIHTSSTGNNNRLMTANCDDDLSRCESAVVCNGVRIVRDSQCGCVQCARLHVARCRHVS